MPHGRNAAMSALHRASHVSMCPGPRVVCSRATCDPMFIEGRRRPANWSVRFGGPFAPGQVVKGRRATAHRVRLLGFSSRLRSALAWTFFDARAADPALSFASFRISDTRVWTQGRNPLSHHSPGDRLGALAPLRALSVHGFDPVLFPWRASNAARGRRAGDPFNVSSDRCLAGSLEVSRDLGIASTQVAGRRLPV